MCDTRVVYKGPLSGPRAPKDAYTRSIADRDVCGMVATHLLSMGWLCLCACKCVGLRAQCSLRHMQIIAAGKPRPAGIR